MRAGSGLLCLLPVAVALLCGHTAALTAEEWRRVKPGQPALHLHKGEVLLEVDEASPQGGKLDDTVGIDPLTPGVHDPAQSTSYKMLFTTKEDVQKGMDAVPFLPWNEKKPKFVGATAAMKDNEIGHKAPELDKDSEQAADPSSIKRECPRARCPENVKCADPTYHCCSTGNYSVCCPSTATCVNTNPPVCLEEQLDDPNACTEEVCKPNFHCPLSKVGSCCLGGHTCCPENGRCTGSDPPMCRALSGWEYLTRKQNTPVAAVNGLAFGPSPASAVYQRDPIPLIPATPVPTATPAVTAAPVAPAATPAAAAGAAAAGPQADAVAAAQKHYDQLPCPDCDKSLFPDAPHSPGERTRQKSFLVPDGGKTYRITITETQRTEAQPGGGLKSTSHRVRTTTLLPADPEQQRLWSAEPASDEMARAFRRLHAARAAGAEGVRELAVREAAEDKMKKAWQAKVDADKKALEAEKAAILALRGGKPAPKPAPAATAAPCRCPKEEPCDCAAAASVAGYAKANGAANVAAQKKAQKQTRAVRKAALARKHHPRFRSLSQGLSDNRHPRKHK